MVTFLVYQPVWDGGFLWDDEGHVTPPALRSIGGLGRIWIEPGATQQYYPLLHTAFWIQHRLWGDATLGYHVVSIGLHAIAACLVTALAGRLGIAGGLLAGFLFAVHPVHVESVAWISEQKNTLSAVFVLAAAIAYLRYDERRNRRAYGLSLVLFVLAVLSKSVTVTLPAALLVLLWWRRGEIDPRRDVVPLAPLFAIGLAAGLVTIWVERTFIGAGGVEFAFSPLQRLLVASRAIWFYLASLVWPAGLSFNYPRWDIDPARASEWLAPAAIVLLAVAFWRIRGRSRAPLAVLLSFVVLLAPALGFVNVYPFRYAFVADHFQYLASIPVLVLAAGLAGTAARDGMRPTIVRAAAALVVVALAMAAWQYSHTFENVETLYAATINRNPSSWFAHTNLGTLKLQTDPAAAVVHLRRAVELKPDLREARLSLGFALQRLGRLDEAAREYREAIRHHPDSAEAHSNLCSVLQLTGDHQGSVAACLRAIELSPAYANAHRNAGGAFEALGRPTEALQHYGEALRLAPSAAVHDARGLLLQRLGRPSDAVQDHRAAIRLQPDSAGSHNHLGAALQRLGRADEAIAAFERAVAIQPSHLDARFNLANALQLARRSAEAIPHYQTILEHNPRDVSAWINLGVALERTGRVADAAAAYREALRLDPSSSQARENLSALQGRNP